MNFLDQSGNRILYWFSKTGDFFILSILWILLCLPIITIIPSSIALFDSVAHCLHGTEDGPVHRFFSTFKSELLRGVLLSVIWLVVGCGLFYGYSILYQIGCQNQTVAIYSLVYLFTLTVPLAVLTWMIPVESRFHHSFFGLFRVAAVYAISHLPTTIMLLILFALASVAVFLMPVLALLIPAITATVQCWFIERVFMKYIPRENRDDSDV